MLILRHLRFCIVILYGICLLSISLVISVLTFQQIAVPLWHRVARLWGKGSLWLLGIDIVEENTCPFVERSARLIMFNHESLLDIFWLCAIGPPAFSCITKDLFRYIPVINLAFWASGQIFIKRKNREQAVKALQSLVQKVHIEQRSIVISPEGTRSTTGALMPLKKGGFHLAIQGSLPLYIVVANGPFSLQPPSSFSAKPGTITIRYLPIINTKLWRRESIDEHISFVYDLMLQHLADMKQQSDQQEPNRT